MTRALVATLVALGIVSITSAGAAPKTLDVYFIDVDGGQATLFVTPAGQTLLVDTGYPERNGRDPDRIQAAMRDAHVSRIDYLLITHMHEDHNGGAAELARRVPIGVFVDYGELMETSPDQVASFTAYRAAREHAVEAGTSRHVIPKPGDPLPLDGVDVRVLSVDGESVATPMAGAGQPNPACMAYDARPFASRENPRSIGIHLRFGKFRLLDLGDLVGPNLLRLVCPDNLIGDIDAYVITHHANADTNVAPLLGAIRPRVAIADNGAYKGGSPPTWAALREHMEIEGVWQLHKSLNYESVNFPDAFIANLEFGDADHGSWIKLSASDDGSFSVTNGRTGWTEHYKKK